MFWIITNRLSKLPTLVNSFRSIPIQVQLKSGTFLEYQSQYYVLIQFSPYSQVSVLQIQLNQELKVHTNSLANINPDTAQSVFSGICSTDTTQSGAQGSHEYQSQCLFPLVMVDEAKQLFKVQQYFAINVNLDTTLYVSMLIPSCYDEA